MIEKSHRPSEIVTEASRLAALASTWRSEPALAIDLESNGFHRYPERVCLVQVATRAEVFLVDPIAVGDMAPFGSLLAERKVEKVLHSADYDLRCLDREWGFRVRGLYDTSVAAHFTGQDRLGLAPTLEQHLAIVVAKHKHLQRADWGRRPLSAEAIDYAAEDVASLLSLRDRLGQKLAQLGRNAWVAEELSRLEEIRYVPPEPPERAYTSVKGSGTLDGKGLAVLKSLYLFRDQEALRRGRPPFRVFSNETLLKLAKEPNADPASVPGLRRFLDGRAGRMLRQAINNGVEAPPEQRPKRGESPRPRPTPEEQRRFDALRAWRMERGKELAFDPSLVWPMSSLERLSREPGSLQEERDSKEVRRWQAHDFSKSLGETLAAL